MKQVTVYTHLEDLTVKEDIRSSKEYMDDLNEEFQEMALLASSKRFFKKNPSRFMQGIKSFDKTECFKCGKTCHFAKDCFAKISLPSYPSPQ